jgi:GH25 family lysozyme M1 (1,4-beta-N-acetylmuramidase)
MFILHPTLKIIGPDISYHQGRINWDLLTSKSSFVIIRTGDGIIRDMKDIKFDINWRDAKVHELPRGCYHFFRPEIDPKLQAEKQVSHLRNDLGEVGIYGDFESNDKGLTKNQVTDSMNEYFRRVDQLTGKITGIYSSPGFWNQFVNYSQIDKLSLRPKWVARWTFASTPLPLPYGWNNWLFWQKSADGNLRGREFGALESSSIDLNVFNGDTTKFKTLFGVESNGSIIDPTEPPTHVKPKITMRIRKEPSDSFATPILGQAQASSLWKIQKLVKDSRGRDWAQINSEVYIAAWLCELIYDSKSNYYINPELRYHGR